MAEAIPAGLRQPEITRYINRANQLQQFKPAIAYWCEYWVVNQILAKQLHNVDDDCLTYTMNLMDKLERTKSEHATDDAIMDDAAGQAYVEQFAQETLDRAEKVVRANRVTRKTADTFDAAATFFLLTSIWGQPDEEAQQKIKYAKWNAMRIFKAVKEGKDPNESNPKRDDREQDPVMPALDPNDPDVRKLAAGPKPVSVEDEPEVEFYTQATHAPASASPAGSTGHPGPPETTGLPLRSPLEAQTQGYFDPPEQFPPSPLSQSGAPDPTAHPDLHPSMPSPSAPSPFSSTGGPPITPTIPQTWQPDPTPQHDKTRTTAPQIYASSPVPAQSPAAPAAVQPWQPSHSHEAGTFSRDDRDIANAQKHAKWAISALNFEDVPTAVKELRNALAALRANP